MARTAAARKYGKSTRNTRAEQLFAELPKSPIKKMAEEKEEKTITAEEKIASTPSSTCSSPSQTSTTSTRESTPPDIEEEGQLPNPDSPGKESPPEAEDSYLSTTSEDLRILTWTDILPPTTQINKIAEASYAEVYRLTNPLGTSIIKVVRLQSPIKPQTKAQQKSGLVDEEPHSPESMQNELLISESLADIPGFVIYKERYVVRGKAPKSLLETHQIFHRKEKRKDPDRLQFYPSPSRYLDDTEFLVVELGDAGTALEDFSLESISQVWDIFLHTAIALARAEDLIQFEHRDLHEGNLCIRQVRSPSACSSPESTATKFGNSGLEITILDYGLSRASFSSLASRQHHSIYYDLEKDLSLFTSTHAEQCKIYRQMRSYLIRGDRINALPASKHTIPYQDSISWRGHFPYTNVLWLHYVYSYLVKNFTGDAKELRQFKKETKELRVHLDPEAPRGVLSFPCAGDVVRFVVEAGWVEEGQLIGDGGDGSTFLSCGGGWDEGVSIVGRRDIGEEKETEGPRRSPRKSG
ncbi:Serine/threonine-protein kinase haspin hrk1 [Cladorrhinum sp. PSN332]|nr:Serine/threonine-protein kinase haspin hrk1 [Cladorrhinum sp. PSN332]